MLTTSNIWIIDECLDDFPLTSFCVSSCFKKYLDIKKLILGKKQCVAERFSRVRFTRDFVRSANGHHLSAQHPSSPKNSECSAHASSIFLLLSAVPVSLCDLSVRPFACLQDNLHHD